MAALNMQGEHHVNTFLCQKKKKKKKFCENAFVPRLPFSFV